MRKAIIVGINGQDGQYLNNLLLQNDFSIIGIDKNFVSSSHLEWDREINISNSEDVDSLVKYFKPDQIYYLAAYHHSSEDERGNSAELLERSYMVNVYSYLNILESVKKYSKHTRIFYACSSHIYGEPETNIQDESSKFSPLSVYAITKLDSLLLSRYYRHNHSIFSSVGILYNHESPLRSEKFVSQKIVKSAVEIKSGKKNELIIGNLNAVLDWGFAGEYVEAMFKILNYHTPNDFVIASGRKSILKEYISIVFKYLDLDWKNYVKEDSSILKNKSHNTLCGDSSKLKNATGWTAKYSIQDIAELMVEAELERQKLEF